MFFYKKNEKFLDYGGGSGLFVRLMREKGFNFYYYYKYSLNIFAKGFEVDLKNNFSFEVITVFEVFEHL